MKKLILSIAILLPILTFAGDTVYVKNVFINNVSVKVKSGYIIHKHGDIWKVNGYKYHLRYYKPTEDPEYKKDVR